MKHETKAEILEINNLTRRSIDQKYLQKAARIIFKKLGLKNKFKISLVIIGEKRMRNLNKKYRKKDKVTDVLSFCYLNNLDWPDKLKIFENYLGEIFICYSQAEKQAREENLPIKSQLTQLLIHGILHLVGYKHRTKKEREEMRKKEEILKNIL